MKKAEIHTGDCFGRLTIIKEVPKRGKFRYFLCRCTCGNEKVIAMGALRKGVTVSCGCYQSEVKHSPKPIKQSENHPYMNTRLYKIWVGMRRRCYKPNNRAYKWYGSRGISICKEWDRFLNFRLWALENGYNETLTIDRINVNGNYEPDNCRWITIQEQQKNRRK